MYNKTLYHNYYVYIITNAENRIFYIGVTNDIERRTQEHKEKAIKGFSSKHNLNKLIYYEYYNNINDAIAREKQLKNWHRDWKLNLINKENPQFKDLSDYK
ncbi:MAG: GIY-YIG nuclease family protein [Patescibacteria group bacterium]